MIVPHYPEIDALWRLDHVGHVVKEFEPHLAFYRDLLGFIVDTQEIIETSNVEVLFLRCENTLIELVRPLPGNVSIAKFIETRGEGLHHICFEVMDLEGELKRLADAGCELIDKAPRPGAKGHRIAFVHPKSTGGVLLELCSNR